MAALCLISASWCGGLSDGLSGGGLYGGGLHGGWLHGGEPHGGAHHGGAPHVGVLYDGPRGGESRDGPHGGCDELVQRCIQMHQRWQRAVSRGSRADPLSAQELQRDFP